MDKSAEKDYKTIVIEILKLNEKLSNDLEDLAENQKSKASFSGATNELADLLKRLSKYQDYDLHWQSNPESHGVSMDHNRYDHIMAEIFTQMSGLQFKTAKKLIQRFKIGSKKLDKQV